MKDKKKEDNEIKLIGCILKVKGEEIILTIEEAFQLKMELEKAFPTPPVIIKEPIYVPNPFPAKPTPMWPSQPWDVPCSPTMPSPYITWCSMTYDSTSSDKVKP